MIPYQGRAAIRVARVVLAFSCLAWYPFTGARISSALAFLIAYAIFAVGALFETKFDSPPRAVVALVIDFTFFTFCKWLLPVDWASALAYGFLLVSAAVLQPFATVLAVAAGAMILILLLTAPGTGVVWADWSAAIMAVAFDWSEIMVLTVAVPYRVRTVADIEYSTSGYLSFIVKYTEFGKMSGRGGVSSRLDSWRLERVG